MLAILPRSGELPVLLAVEAAAGRRKTLLAERSVLDTLQQHRLAELRSTGESDGSVAGSAQECPLSWSYSHVCSTGRHSVTGQGSHQGFSLHITAVGTDTCNRSGVERTAQQ